MSIAALTSTRSHVLRGACLLGVALALATTAPACSQGDGVGTIVGTLDVPDCWTGSFDLHPDFLAAVPYRDSLTLRIQSGSDFETFSDGLSILITDRNEIRPDASTNFAGRYGEALRVDLPPGVAAPGTPIAPDADPALVNMTLYLQRTCRTKTVTLQAVDEVTLPSDDKCAAQALPGADPTQACDPSKSALAGKGTGKSTIAFTAISNGKLDEETAAERLNAGCFDIYLADPREADPGGQGPPPPCRGHLRGAFSFFYERGRPSQPFP